MRTWLDGWPELACISKHSQDGKSPWATHALTYSSRKKNPHFPPISSPNTSRWGGNVGSPKATGAYMCKKYVKCLTQKLPRTESLWIMIMRAFLLWTTTDQRWKCTNMLFLHKFEVRDCMLILDGDHIVIITMAMIAVCDCLVTCVLCLVSCVLYLVSVYQDAARRSSLSPRRWHWVWVCQLQSGDQKLSKSLFDQLLRSRFYDEYLHNFMVCFGSIYLCHFSYTFGKYQLSR